MTLYEDERPPVIVERRREIAAARTRGETERERDRREANERGERRRAFNLARRAGTDLSDSETEFVDNSHARELQFWNEGIDADEISIRTNTSATTHTLVTANTQGADNAADQQKQQRRH